MSEQDFETAFQKYAELAKSEYGISLDMILADTNLQLREKRLWRLTGVILKESYSERVKRKRPAKATGAHFRYDIDARKLHSRIRSSGWEAQLLEVLPGRKDNEGVEVFALRLKSEIRTGKSIRKYICDWLCGDPQTYKALDKAFKNVGAGNLGKMARPGQVVFALSSQIAGSLPHLSHNQFLFLTAIIFSIGVLGIRATCEEWREKPVAKVPAMKSPSAL